jgi:hypothetical protein
MSGPRKKSLLRKAMEDAMDTVSFFFKKFLAKKYHEIFRLDPRQVLTLLSSSPFALTLSRSCTGASVLA